MRVIAGSARGTVLVAPPRGTRPVSDRAREGLFSSLGPSVDGAACLDLFAGSGALGIEALSRGAARCTFVDRARGAAEAIRENLRRTHLEDDAAIVVRDVADYLREPGADGVSPALVFVDPPYDLEVRTLEGVLVSLHGSTLPSEGWIVVVTRGHKSPQPAVPVDWAARRQLRYGDSLLLLYRPRSSQEVGWA